MQSHELLRDELLAEVEAVAPILTEHAPQSEKLGRLDEHSVEALRKTRLLSFVCPRELGGYEADPVTTMEILQAVTRVDGSAGWTLGILAITSVRRSRSIPPARWSSVGLRFRATPVISSITPSRGAVASCATSMI